VVLGLVRDERETIRRKVEESLLGCDLTLLSGGSSVGARDLTAEVFGSFDGARLLVHGVSVAPGKPFVWVRVGEHNLLGLPGQVASCMVAFHLFVEPVMERLLGRQARSFVRFGRVGARLGRNVAAAPGRELYQRVRLERDDEGWRAEPVLGKSGVLRTLTRGHGLVRVPLGCEGLERGEQVEVLTFP
jgi:molybdopterin molybdotransferase